MWGEVPRNKFQISFGREKLVPHHPEQIALENLRFGPGWVLPLLSPLLIQSDPPVRMGVWHENRVGKRSVVWDCVGML